MKSLLSIITISLFAAGSLFFTAEAEAQDRRTMVIERYNEAQELAGARNFDGAIELLEEVIDLSEGEAELADMVERATNLLPRVFMSRASVAFQQFQQQQNLDNINTAIRRFEEAVAAGEKYSSEEVLTQSRGSLPQLHYMKSIVQFRAEDLDSAIASLDEAIRLNANYALAYYQKGVVIKAKDRNNIDAYSQWYDRAITIGEQFNDAQTVQRAKNGMRDELIYQGVQAKDNRQFTRAVELLERVASYDNASADANYRLAEVQNMRQNWDSAIRYANRALELERGSVVDRAKIYFELGVAYQGKGDVSRACEAYTNAAHGPFREAAEHEMEFVLKCNENAR